MSEKEIKAKAQEELKPEVRINGQLYRLRFDLWALEQIEQEFGGIRQAFMAMDDGSMVQTVRKLFAILANCQRNYDGLPEDITGDVITRHESMAKLREISVAIRAAMTEGMRSETSDGGEASDKKKNPLDEEYNAKNG
jgi:hypothetical protein